MRINAPAKLAVAWLTMFLVGTELFVFSPLLPVLASDYHVTPALAGLSVTMFSLAYMTSAPLFGYISDRIGRRRVLICSLLAFALANILTPASQICRPCSQSGFLPAPRRRVSRHRSTLSSAALPHQSAAPPGWRW
jgi:MFS family permease